MTNERMSIVFIPQISSLVETARPSSPTDESREKYRRSGYDKQGEAGAGTARPEFVRIR